ADASHELKTPITVMLANTSILLNDKTYDKKTAGKWISYIDIEAKRMKKLVEDLLFLARLDNKESPYQLTKVSISDIVSENTLPFEAILFETGKNLNTDIQPNLYVNADADQLAHLVTILLDNANKYAGNHLPVTVRLKSDRNMAVLSVTNFGEPISKENLPHVFNRFFRGDKARGRSQSSSGLGLSIAKQIVDSYHGKISVRSDATNGTTFTVLLPLC
ncbi:MAG: HAMP domain-containing sensor histidine kinase, partial [Eubacteriales bacterium]